MAKNGEAAIPEQLTLPYHLLEQILLRLPAAVVHLFRAVCKGWRGIIDSEYFIASHRRQRGSPRPLFLYRDEGSSLVRFDLQAIDVAARETHQVLRFADVPDPHALGPGLCWLCRSDEIDIADSLFKIEGSCDGILLVSHLDRLYACNPCTGHWQSLPPIHQDDGIIGFYAQPQDPPGGGTAYRVLHQTGAPCVDLSYRILELGAEEPHDIGRPASPGTPQILPFMVLLGGFPPAHREPPTMFQGSLHWLPILPRTHMITVFDTAAQEFRWISPPILNKAPASATFNFITMFREFQLFEIDGWLAIAVINYAGTTIHVRVLQDYPNGPWVPRYQIELPPAAITHDIGFDHRDHPHPPAYVLPQERDVLLRCPYAMLHCDAAGNVLRQYSRPHHRILATPHMFEESLAQHAFLSRRGSDGDNIEFLVSHTDFVSCSDEP